MLIKCYLPFSSQVILCVLKQKYLPLFWNTASALTYVRFEVPEIVNFKAVMLCSLIKKKRPGFSNMHGLRVFTSKQAESKLACTYMHFTHTLIFCIFFPGTFGTACVFNSTGHNFCTLQQQSHKAYQHFRVTV